MARDRKIIRDEVRAYLSELLAEAGVEDRNPWHWGMDILRCIVKWERRASTWADRFWQGLVIASLGTLGMLLATGFKAWLAAGGQ